jgi:L-ascorbate metabolism protein UlaG (beta-lactamase superfamily)
MTEPVYLRPNVVVEPLCMGWYAWMHLISPATAAMNVAERHLGIMASYVQAPQIHEAAARDPQMLGGPFMDYRPGRTAEIAGLMRETRRRQARQLTLAADLRSADELLQAEASGYSLEPLYGRLPDGLRGYVELVYDLNNHAAMRLLEPLLYASPYYDESLQSVALSLMEADADRAFVLSTPRLAGPERLLLELPFAHPGLDELFRMKRAPRPLAEIAARLAVPAAEMPRFTALFTAEPPAPYRPYEGPGIRTRYFGHACVLVETREVSILSDPVISYEYTSDIPRYTYADLPDRLDYVVITHNHQDHILLETLLQLRHKIGTIVVPRSGGGALQDPSLKLALRRIGFPNVVEISELETLDLPGGRLVAVPFLGEHSDLNIQTKMAYLVSRPEGSLLLAADSCNVEPRIYQHVRELLGPIDLLFLGMECDGAPLSWLYGPLLTRPIDRRMDRSRRLSGSNYERGIDLVERFECKYAYVYAMGMEPWLRHIMAKEYTPESDPIVASEQLIRNCRARGLGAERLFGEREILLN